MKDKTTARLRRAGKTRRKLAQLKAVRLTVHRTNMHMYAQIIDRDGGRVLVSASTVEPDVRKEMAYGGNVKAAALIGQRIATRAKQAGIETVSFDRAGYRFHGRVKALAEAAREHGLKF